MSNSEQIWFSSATVYARKIDVYHKLVAFTGVHRGQMAKLETGYLIIEKQWFPKKKDEESTSEK